MKTFFLFLVIGIAVSGCGDKTTKPLQFAKQGPPPLEDTSAWAYVCATEWAGKPKLVRERVYKANLEVALVVGNLEFPSGAEVEFDLDEVGRIVVESGRDFCVYPGTYETLSALARNTNLNGIIWIGHGSEGSLKMMKKSSLHEYELSFDSDGEVEQRTQGGVSELNKLTPQWKMHLNNGRFEEHVAPDEVPSFYSRNMAFGVFLACEFGLKEDEWRKILNLEPSDPIYSSRSSIFVNEAEDFTEWRLPALLREIL